MLLVVLLTPTAFLFCQRLGGHQHQLKISTLRLADLVNPGLEIGYETFHTDRFSFSCPPG